MQIIKQIRLLIVIIL